MNLGLNSHILGEWFYYPVWLSARILVYDFLLLISVGVAIVALIIRGGILGLLAEILSTLPLVFPPIATGFLLLSLLGKGGILGAALFKLNISFIFDIKGLVLAAFIASLPLFVKPIVNAIKSVDINLLHASYALGKNKAQTYLYVVFPSIKKVFIAATFIALSRSLGEVGVSLMLGGDIVGRTDTLSLAVYNAVLDGENDKAWVLCVMLATISLLLFALSAAIAKRG